MPNCKAYCAKEGFEGQATWPLCLKRDQENTKEKYPRSSLSHLFSYYSGSTLVTTALGKPKS